MSAATGRASTASFGCTFAEGGEQIVDASNESGPVPRAVKVIDSTVVRANEHPGGEERGSETSFQPFEAWLHGQDTFPRQRHGPLHEIGHHGRVDLLRSGLLSCY